MKAISALWISRFYCIYRVLFHGVLATNDSSSKTLYSNVTITHTTLYTLNVDVETPILTTLQFPTFAATTILTTLQSSTFAATPILTTLQSPTFAATSILTTLQSPTFAATPILTTLQSSTFAATTILTTLQSSTFAATKIDLLESTTTKRGVYISSEKKPSAISSSFKTYTHAQTGKSHSFLSFNGCHSTCFSSVQPLTKVPGFLPTQTSPKSLLSTLRHASDVTTVYDLSLESQTVFFSDATVPITTGSRDPKTTYSVKIKSPSRTQTFSPNVESFAVFSSFIRFKQSIRTESVKREDIFERESSLAIQPTRTATKSTMLHISSSFSYQREKSMNNFQFAPSWHRFVTMPTVSPFTRKISSQYSKDEKLVTNDVFHSTLKVVNTRKAVNSYSLKSESIWIVKPSAVLQSTSFAVPKLSSFQHKQSTFQLKTSSAKEGIASQTMWRSVSESSMRVQSIVDGGYHIGDSATKLLASLLLITTLTGSLSQTTLSSVTQASSDFSGGSISPTPSTSSVTSSTSIAPMTTVSPEVLYPFLQENFKFDVSGKLNLPFTSELNNPGSEKFRNLSDTILDEIENTMLNDGFFYGYIKSFKEGSVIFDAALYFNTSYTNVTNTLIVSRLSEGTLDISEVTSTEQCTAGTCNGHGTCDVTRKETCWCGLGYRGTRCQHTYPVNGTRRMWSTWSECTRTCGNGTSQRVGACHPKPLHGGVCMLGNESINERKPCAENKCPLKGEDHEDDEYVYVGIICGVVFLIIIILTFCYCCCVEANSVPVKKNRSRSPLKTEVYLESLPTNRSSVRLTKKPTYIDNQSRLSYKSLVVEPKQQENSIQLQKISRHQDEAADSGVDNPVFKGYDDFIMSDSETIYKKQLKRFFRENPSKISSDVDSEAPTPAPVKSRKKLVSSSRYVINHDSDYSTPVKRKQEVKPSKIPLYNRIEWDSDASTPKRNVKQKAPPRPLNENNNLETKIVDHGISKHSFVVK